MPSIIEILKTQGITIPEDKMDELKTLFSDFKDQETVNKSVTTAKTKAKAKAQAEFLKDLGVETLEDAKKILSKGKVDDKANPDLEEIKKEMSQLKKDAKKQSDDLEREKSENGQVSQLTKLGFTEDQAKELRVSFASQVTDDKDFAAVIKEKQESTLYKSQFELANKQLSSGTVKIGEESTESELSEETQDAIASIFGNKK